MEHLLKIHCQQAEAHTKISIGSNQGAFKSDSNVPGHLLERPRIDSLQPRYCNERAVMNPFTTARRKSDSGAVQSIDSTGKRPESFSGGIRIVVVDRSISLVGYQYEVGAAS